MNTNILPTYNNSMYKHSYTFYGKDDCLYVKENAERKELEYFFYVAESEHKTLCFIKQI